MKTTRLDCHLRPHCVDRPAIIDENGGEYWYRHGGLHRSGGLPAVSKLDGTLRYYEDNSLHRVDGPAAVEPDGSERFYYRGHRLPELAIHAEFDDVTDDLLSLTRPDGTQVFFRDDKIVSSVPPKSD